MNLLKYLSTPASIYLVEVKNGNTRRSVFDILQSSDAYIEPN